MKCPDPIQLDAFVDGELPEGAAAFVEGHLAECAACASQVRRTRRLVELLRRQRPETLDEGEVARLLQAARQGMPQRTAGERPDRRRALTAAAVVLVLGAAALAHRAGLGDGTASVPAPAPDSLSLALLREHQGYEAALLADPEFNVQVAVLGR